MKPFCFDISHLMKYCSSTISDLGLALPAELHDQDHELIEIHLPLELVPPLVTLEDEVLELDHAVGVHAHMPEGLYRLVVGQNFLELMQIDQLVAICIAV